MYTHSVSHAHFSDTFSLRGVRTSRTRMAQDVCSAHVISPHLTFSLLMFHPASLLFPHGHLDTSFLSAPSLPNCSRSESAGQAHFRMSAKESGYLADPTHSTPIRPEWMHGYLREGRRKDLELMHRATGERLRAAGVTHISDLEDMSNAFACTASQELFWVKDELVREREREKDISFFNMRATWGTSWARPKLLAKPSGWQKKETSASWPSPMTSFASWCGMGAMELRECCRRRTR